MHVRVLGSAAGGGLPQWNCNCANCKAARANSPNVARRTQSSVAVSSDARQWFLLNVSPDVRQQILAFPALGPTDDSRRGTAIAGCLVTDAEMDHTSGLLQLREGCTMAVHSTSLVRQWLNDYLSTERVLSRFADCRWNELPLDEDYRLTLRDGTESGLVVRAFETSRDVPLYVTDHSGEAIGSVVALEVRDVATSGKLVYAPGVASINSPLDRATDGADAILLDGTFWSDEEPLDAGIGRRTAREMGHLPVSGSDGSLQWLAKSSARHRVYVHINNTNPMLDRQGPEHRLVREHGVIVGSDGDEFVL